jgi:hypothetical protein
MKNNVRRYLDPRRAKITNHIFGSFPMLSSVGGKEGDNRSKVRAGIAYSKPREASCSSDRSSASEHHR